MHANTAPSPIADVVRIGCRERVPLQIDFHTKPSNGLSDGYLQWVVKAAHQDALCLAAAAVDRDHVVAIHGCGGKAQRVLMGGLDDPLKISIGQAIARLGVEVDLKGHSFPATDPNNICNRGRRGVGVQVELTLGLRLDGPRDAVSAAIRSVLLNLPNELPGGDQRR